MIKNFHKVRDNLFRGAEPTMSDVVSLVKKFKIKKIVSLDKASGIMIEPICDKLDIEQVIIDIDPGNINSLKNLLKYNINELLDPSIPTFVHCFRGKDRAGLLIALARCMFDDWDCKKAIKEAKQLGFGTGLDLPVEKFYIKLIRKSCKDKHEDSNHAYDIVDGADDYDSMYRDEQMDPYHLSWSTDVDSANRKYPEAFVDINQYEEQYQTRENYGLKGIKEEEHYSDHIPMVGVYDQNTQITNMVGPSLIGSGFV